MGKKSKQALTTSEQYTWGVIQEHYEQIPELSISKLAEIAHVSISTITRTVMKKGFAGYSAFRHSIREQKTFVADEFPSEVLDALRKNEEELIKTINNISPSDLEYAVHLLDESEEILIFAHGLSLNAANELLRKLQLFHKPISLFDDFQQMVYYAGFASPKTLIIVQSLLGESEGINQAVEIAKSKNGKILAITASEQSTLTQLADVALVGYKSSYEVNYFDVDIHSRLPLFVLGRVLVDVYSIYRNGRIK
ncbi:MurR/RpiR family transcriptional regulator [Lactococcus ileimucosae]|uniref:MurR/RpiR family transcriptional regulator n=1 Tax=Lactococcus ileimucosae TaxID=2941329 RepID=A0ABV4D4Q1_9LACT